MSLFCGQETLCIGGRIYYYDQALKWVSPHWAQMKSRGKIGPSPNTDQFIELNNDILTLNIGVRKAWW